VWETLEHFNKIEISSLAHFAIHFSCLSPKQSTICRGKNFNLKNKLFLIRFPLIPLASLLNPRLCANSSPQWQRKTLMLHGIFVGLLLAFLWH